MRYLMTTAAVIALLSAAPVSAQTAEDAQDAGDNTAVLRNDLPETHAGFDLPSIDPGSAEIEASARRELSLHALGAVQIGNLAAAKHASGIVRDLGDAMILLHSAVLDRIAPDDQGSDMTLRAETQDRLAALDALNGAEFNRGLADWIVETYPGMISAWRQAGETQALRELSQAIVPHLEQQQAVAEAIVAAEGDLEAVDSQAVAALQMGGADVDAAGGTETAGTEGQTGERQHTPEPEPPAVQTGENYEQEQVEVDPQSATRAPDAQQGNTAAGELDIANAGGLFAALNNPEVELQQLEGQDWAADQVKVMPVDDLLTDAELESLQTSLDEVGEGKASPWQAATSHTAISGAIEAAEATADDVVAIDVLDEGVVVYTYSR